VRALGLVKLQRAGEGVQDAGRCTGDLAAFEPCVVLDAEFGDCGDLAAPQAGHTSAACRWQADLFGVQPGATRGQELAHIGTVVHPAERRPRVVNEGFPVSTPIDRDFQLLQAACSLEAVGPSGL
jgi:hypothetical protein